MCSSSNRNNDGYISRSIIQRTITQQFTKLLLSRLFERIGIEPDKVCKFHYRFVPIEHLRVNLVWNAIRSSNDNVVSKTKPRPIPERLSEAPKPKLYWAVE